MAAKVPRTSPATEAPRGASSGSGGRASPPQSPPTAISSPFLGVATEREGAARFSVMARPRARESRVAAVREGAVVVQIAAPPVDGAANAELVALLARVLGVAKRDVAIVRGEGGRAKIVEVRGLRAADVEARLRAAAGVTAC